MTREEIFGALEELWTQRDPMPDGLVERMQALVHAEVALADTDLDYELMLLIERTSELAGTRSAGTAYTLRFGGDNLDLLVRAGGGNGGATTRLDGWVVPPEPMTVRALPEQTPARHAAVVTDTGRFELTDLPLGLLRLRLEPHDATRPAFATPTFEI